MLVSLSKRLAILATPKCASSALEAALAPTMDVVIGGHPGAKHTPYRKFDRFLRPYLESFGTGRIETMCLVREPLDWLHSWWRYRGRDGIPDPAMSTRAMSFAAFVEAHLDDRPGPARVGRQSRFVAARDGTVGVDRVFRYEALPAACAWLEARLGLPLRLERMNVSPEAPRPALPADLARRVEAELAPDLALHAGAAH